MAVSSLGGVDSYQYLNDSSTTGSLEKTLNSDLSQSDDANLMKVCKEFESYFVEQMFKEMKKTVPETESSSSANNSMMDYYSDMLYQNYANASTENDNLGLAKSLYEQMKRNYDL